MYTIRKGNALCSSRGFTLVEILVVVGIILALSAIVMPRLLDSFVFAGDDTWGDAKDITHLLSIAQSNAASNRDNDHWGVHLVDDGTTDCGTSTTKDCIVIYKGTSFSSRDSTYDQQFVLRANNRFDFPELITSSLTNKYCASAEEIDGPGSSAWTSEGNACASDSSFAQSSVGGSGSEYLKVTGFNVGVPTGARIDGIKLSVHRKAGANNCIRDADIKIVKRGTITTLDKASSSNWPTTTATQEYGSTNDLWDETWSAADINSSDFGFVISVSLVGICSPPTAFVDSVSVAVYYTANFDDKDFYFNKGSGLAKGLYGVPANPIAYYSFENATSSDMSGNGFEGSTTGVTFTTFGGTQNSTLAEFDGSSAHVNLGNPTAWPSGTGARSVCAWALTQTDTGAHKIFSYGSSGANRAFFIGMTGTTLNGGGSTTGTITSASFWDMTDWHHVCLTYTGTHASLYGDGALLTGPLSRPSWSLIQGKAYIGRFVATDTEYWDGFIDELYLYDRALSDEEIFQLYESTSVLPSRAPTPSQIFITNGTATSIVEVYANGYIRSTR